MPYTFDVLLVSPTREQIELADRDACANANASARTRTVSVGIDADKILTQPAGIIEGSGGGVPNSYRYTAETSAVGFAWFTDKQGNKHLRVVGGRIAAPKSAYGRGEPNVFGVTATDVERHGAASMAVEAVYPELGFDRRKKSLVGQAKGFLLALHADVLDMAARAAYADWLEEAGKSVFAKAEREALARLEVLAMMPKPKRRRRSTKRKADDILRVV